MTISRGVWLVSGGVRMVYGWYLGVAWTFWIMSSVYWCQINWEKSTRYRFNELSQFLPVVHFRLKQAHRPKFSTGGGRIFFGVNDQFFGSDGQVMDVGTQWGWWRRKILTGPIYPPTLALSELFFSLSKPNWPSLANYHSFDLTIVIKHHPSPINGLSVCPFVTFFTPI